MAGVDYDDDRDYQGFSDDLDEIYGPQNTKCKNKQKKNGGQRKKSLTNSSIKHVNGPIKQAVPPEQPSLSKTSEYLAEDQVVKAKADARLRRRSQSGSQEMTDIDEELANLIKEMTLPPKTVLYYGWFFCETISESLRKLSESFLKECLEIQQFQRWMATNCELKEVQGKLLLILCIIHVIFVTSA